jgi:hypothetical protein
MVLHEFVGGLDVKFEAVEKKRELRRVGTKDNSREFGLKIADKVGKTPPPIHADRVLKLRLTIGIQIFNGEIYLFNSERSS